MPHPIVAIARSALVQSLQLYLSALFDGPYRLSVAGRPALRAGGALLTDLRCRLAVFRVSFSVVKLASSVTCRVEPYGDVDGRVGNRK